MEPFDQQPAAARLADALAEVRAARRRDPDALHLFELTALRWGPFGVEQARTDLDGGCRVEWLEPGAAAPCLRARFLIGAGPHALVALRSGTEPTTSAWTWWSEAKNELTRGLEPDSDAIAASLGRAAEMLGRPLRARVDHGLRLRAWSAPSFLLERGATALSVASEVGAETSAFIRVSLCPAEADWSGEPIEWIGSHLGAAPWETPFVKLRRQWASAVIKRWETLPEVTSVRGATSGRELILTGSAAAVFAHELAHAALERGPAWPATAKHGLRILDDPRRGGWPVGFTHDDDGHPARGAVLWDADGGHRPSTYGRRRRGNLREPAVGALSCTILDATEATAPPHERAELMSAGALLAEGCRTGRFDPCSGKIVLQLERLSTMRCGGAVGVAGALTAVISPDRAWTGLALVNDSSPFALDFGRCTRHGRVSAVMVGAPTIVLEPDQIDFAEG